MKTWTAWSAGDVYWCKAHEHRKHTPGTKVCVDWFTGGQMICPRCKPSAPPTTIAYVPLYREVDHKPCVVICHETVSDFLLGVEYGVQVMVGRVESTSSVFVKPTATQTLFVTTHPLRKRPCDLSCTLLTMWGYPALTQWVQLQERKQHGRDPAEATEEEKQKVAAVHSPMFRNAALRYGKPDDAKSLEDTQTDLDREILKRVQRNGSNGKPH